MLVRQSDLYIFCHIIFPFSKNLLLIFNRPGTKNLLRSNISRIHSQKLSLVLGLCFMYFTWIWNSKYLLHSKTRCSEAQLWYPMHKLYELQIITSVCFLHSGQRLFLLWLTWDLHCGCVCKQFEWLTHTLHSKLDQCGSLHQGLFLELGSEAGFGAERDLRYTN